MWPRPYSPVERVCADGGLEVARACRRCAGSRCWPFADDRDARRVVAAVLEPAQPVDEDGHDLLRTDVADDAAHIMILVGLERHKGQRAKRVRTRSQRTPTPATAQRAPRRTSRTALTASRQLFFFRSTQPSMFDLAPARDAERAGRHVLDDRRAGGDVGAVADA